jgi:hypothetical protein
MSVKRSSSDNRKDPRFSMGGLPAVVKMRGQRFAVKDLSESGFSLAGTSTLAVGSVEFFDFSVLGHHFRAAARIVSSVQERIGLSFMETLWTPVSNLLQDWIYSSEAFMSISVGLMEKTRYFQSENQELKVNSSILGRLKETKLTIGDADYIIKFSKDRIASIEVYSSGKAAFTDSPALRQSCLGFTIQFLLQVRDHYSEYVDDHIKFLIDVQMSEHLIAATEETKAS